uniref:Fibrosin n=1 Tax=Pseudonaja textilis TaxID=8673 RepID=A0A670YVD2_PSETE
MDGLLRHNFYPAYPPTVSGISPVLPPAVNFGSLQGAFQPKSTNPDLPSRLGAVPPSISQKGTQITDPFRPTLRKPGKWCAMHVRVAYMILRHQEKIKGDPHKLDFRNDLLTGLPEAGAFGSLPHSQELARPATLFTAAGVVHPGNAPSFGPAATPHGSFLNPSPHIDPFGRPPSFASLAALSNGAFGGLGNPSFNSSAVFGQKDSPGAPAFPSPHEAWNRLHRTPPSFPTAPAWPKGATPTSKNPSLIHEEPPSRPHVQAEREHRYGSPASSGHASRSPYPELPLKKEVKVKEEPDLPGFEGALRTGASYHSTLHVSHPLGPLAVFERPQAGTGGSVSPYLVAAPPSAASYAALEAWREPYHRGLELHPLQRLPRYLETPSPAAAAAEDYERARLYGLAPPPHPSLMAYPRHQNGLLAKATPSAAVGLLSAPPPLIPASNARPCSPRRAPDIRELAASYKDRDSR